MIIVDDCSFDNTVELIENYIRDDVRIRLIKLSSNMGAAVARNYGIEAIKGEFLAFIDSDDIWMPEKLEKQLSFMNSNNYSISFTAYELIGEEGIRMEKVIKANNCVNLKSYLKDTRIGFSTSMINLSVIGEVKLLNIRSRQDGQLWISLLKQGFNGIDEILCRYRVHKNSISANKFKATYNMWRLYYRIEKLGLIKSIYYFSHYLYNAIKKRI